MLFQRFVPSELSCSMALLAIGVWTAELVSCMRATAVGVPVGSLASGAAGSLVPHNFLARAGDTL